MRHSASKRDAWSVIACEEASSHAELAAAPLPTVRLCCTLYVLCVDASRSNVWCVVCHFRCVVGGVSCDSCVGLGVSTMWMYTRSR